jgi:hypothetical protein
MTPQDDPRDAILHANPATRRAVQEGHSAATMDRIFAGHAFHRALSAEARLTRADIRVMNAASALHILVLARLPGRPSPNFRAGSSREQVADALAAPGVTAIWGVPSSVRLVLRTAAERGLQPPRLRHLLMSGEDLPESGRTNLVEAAAALGASAVVRASCLRPLPPLGRKQRAEGGRRAACRRRAELGEARGEVRLRQRLVAGGVEPLQGGVRRGGRHDEAGAELRAVAGQHLGNRRQLGVSRQPLGRRDGRQPRTVRLQLRQQLDQGRQHRVHTARGEVEHGGAAAPAGHVQHADRGALARQLRRDMRQRAFADRCIAQRPGPRARR